MTRRRPLHLLALIAVAASVLAGCASSEGTHDGLRIVAATNVYGDIAQAIAGDAAEVTSIIHDAAQDPHEYEASARDALAVADADLVIVNGGGYDDFMTTLLDAHGDGAVVLDAVQLSGLASAAAHGELNEHVWYDLAAMKRLAVELAARLGELDPADTAAFTANATTFTAGLDALAATASGIAAAHAGERVAITEPVPLHLLEAAGLVNATPDAFSKAVEEGTDASALVLRDVVALVGDGSIAFLAYNEQTVGSQTQQVLDAARAAGTPVVSFTELLPDGADYLGWMRGNLDAVEAALAG